MTLSSDNQDFRGVEKQIYYSGIPYQNQADRKAETTRGSIAIRDASLKDEVHV